MRKLISKFKPYTNWFYRRLRVYGSDLVYLVYSWLRFFGEQLWRVVKPYVVLGILYAEAFRNYAYWRWIADPHLYLRLKWRWYDRWSRLKYSKAVNSAVGAFVCLLLVFIIGGQMRVRAVGDLSLNWDFSSSAPYTFGNGLETSGSSARLKAQNYATDGNTMALYHFDEASGSTVSDSSGNGNNATVNNASFGSGNLNNSLSFDGSTSSVSAPDSASLSLTQNNTIEAWTKFNSTFGVGTHDQKQGIVDKGAYRLYYDQETGKVTYELADATATNWTQQAGNDTKNSWDLNGKLAVNAEVSIGSDIYAGLGNAVGDAEVWKWDGSTWTQLGGDGTNSSWAAQTYENVVSMTHDGNTLYAGLGSSTGDGEVWSCDVSTGCTTWTKIGGDGINSGWPVNKIEEVDSMTVMGGNLYVGTGTSTNDAQVWKWDGSSWTEVGGFGIGAPYNAFTTGYEAVYSLTNDGTHIYAGFGSTAGDGDIWELSGTTWTQIGGDGLNSGWPAATIEDVISMRWFNGKLYAGLGTTAGDGTVWSWNGSAWTEIGGNGVNSSWAASTYEGVYSFADDGTNLYAGLGNTAGDNEVWKWDGSSWSKIGGDGVNSGFSNTYTIVQSMVYANGKLYAGLQASATNAAVWSFDGTAWTQIGGGYINNSWGYYNLQDVESMTKSGDYLYAGTGNTVAGNAQIWRFNGSTWQIIGGQGINNSWAANTYQDVSSMISYGGDLYVGLGVSTNYAQVWKWDGSTWTQIGGGGLNSGWSGYQKIDSMAVLNNDLYVGLGTATNAARIYKWDGSTWTWVGGFGIGAPYNAFTTGYENVVSMAVYGGHIYAGMGTSTGDADIWELSGTTWTQIGGDAKNSGWASNTYEEVDSLLPYNGKLYAGLGTGTGDAEVWAWDGTTWSMVGGDGLNNSWPDGQYEQTRSLVVYDGKLYAGLGNSAGDGEVWALDNGTWSMVGGSGTNSSWPANTIEMIQSFSVYHGKLYAGLGNTANNDAQIWSYGNNGFLQSSTVGQDTNWHHIAATYDGSTMKIYIDGQLDAQTSVSLSMPDTDQSLLIGSTYGTTESGWGQGVFNGKIDELRISNVARTSFTTKPYTTTAQTITLNSPVWQNGVWYYDSLGDSETANGGSINYRVSNDGGSSWQYWNGTAWAASSGTNQANDVATINANMQTFPTTVNGLEWQAVLQGDGTQQVTLNSVNATATSDTTAPSANASAITAAKTHGGSTLNANDWTNSSAPYFSWAGGTDGQSGIKGYCLYLGTDSTADPVTTKGMLGTSPTATGGSCQFLVTDTNLDLATSGYLASAFTTSNSPYYLRIKAIDNAGNVYGTSDQFAFKFDNTPPTNPSYITAPSGFVNTKQITMTWPTSGSGSPSDADSGVVGLQYKIDNSPWYGSSHTGTGDINDLLTNNGSYTTQTDPDFNNLIEGVNTVYFRTWDAAGNVTTSYVTAALKINTSGAPSEPQNLTATPSSNTVNAFAFNWDQPATFVGDAGNLSYCYTVNVVPSSANCTFEAAGVTSLGSGAYATQPGTNTFYVAAKDESGNINYDSYASVNFTANTAAPGIPLNTDIVDVSIKATSNWRLALTWDAPSDTGAGIASYKVYRSTDNHNFSFVGSSSSTTYIDAGLSQQTYYYYVKACDSTNNCGALGSTVHDLPTGKFTSPASLVAPPVVSNITTRKATINWSTDRTSDSKIALGTESGHYSPSEIANSSQVSAHQLQLDNLSAGTTYYFIAQWTDEDGNTGTSQEYSFTTAPPPTISEISAINVGLSAATIKFTSANATRVAVYYGPTSSFGGVVSINTSTTTSTYTVPLTGLNDGTKYYYKLVAYDSDGNSYDGNTNVFTTPPRPVISNVRFQPVAGEPTSTQQVTWDTNVPADSTINYGISGTSGTTEQIPTTTTSHSITVSDLTDNSEYFLVAQSRDINGNLATSDRQQFHTALDTRPPKITNITIQPTVRGTGAEARGQVVVSWSTDEPATSQVAYAQGASATDFSQSTAEDDGLSFEHIVIVSDLPTSKVYSVVPISKDKAGNVARGSSQTTVVGRASDDVMTVVLNTLKKVFGF